MLEQIKIPKYFDNTRKSSGASCLRGYYLRHIRHWRKEGTKPALANGSAWHKGQDQIWPNIDIPLDPLVDLAVDAWRDYMIEEGIDVDDPAYSMNNIQNEGTAKDMFRNYTIKNERFLKEIELLDIERAFAVPLIIDQDLFYIGRLDKTFRLNNRVHVMEHKTTSSYKKDGPFRSDFLQSFSPDSQIDGYLFAGNLIYGEEFKSVWIDAALVHKTVHNGFQVIPIEKAFSMLDSWLFDTCWWIEKIITEIHLLNNYRAEGKILPFLPCFPKNTGNCSIYAGCTYRDICRFHPNPEDILDIPEGFVEKRWEPFDEEALEELGIKEKEDA